MKVVINAISALRGGGQTYLINLLQEFISSDLECDLVIITNKKNSKIFSKFESDNIIMYESSFASLNIVFRVLWEVFYLPLLLFNFKASSYFAPGGIMVTITPKFCKSYTALRNMLPFDKRERARFPFFSYIRFKLWLLKHIFLISYKFSDGVIFISNHSRDEVKKYIDNIEMKSSVIYHGINESFLIKQDDFELLSCLGLSPGEYYLYVSILDVYKAQREVVNEWLELTKSGGRYPLVLVGPNYNDYGNQVVKLIEGSNNELVKYVGPISYDKLPPLYQGARALIFASSCECCPNILLEKLASGRPVISSNIMPMPEFGNDAAIYFDPYSKGSLTKAVTYLESEGSMIKHSRLSAERAKDFSWELTTKNTFSYLLSDL